MSDPLTAELSAKVAIWKKQIVPFAQAFVRALDRYPEANIKEQVLKLRVTNMTAAQLDLLERIGRGAVPTTQELWDFGVTIAIEDLSSSDNFLAGPINN